MTAETERPVWGPVWKLSKDRQRRYYELRKQILNVSPDLREEAYGFALHGLVLVSIIVPFSRLALVFTLADELDAISNGRTLSTIRRFPLSRGDRIVLGRGLYERDITPARVKELVGKSVEIASGRRVEIPRDGSDRRLEEVVAALSPATRDAFRLVREALLSVSPVEILWLRPYSFVPKLTYQTGAAEFAWLELSGPGSLLLTFRRGIALGPLSQRLNVHLSGLGTMKFRTVMDVSFGEIRALARGAVGMA